MYIKEEVWKEYLDSSSDMFNLVGKSFLNSYDGFSRKVLGELDDKKILYNDIHSLKGVTLNLGMKELYDGCVQLLYLFKQDIYDKENIMGLLKVFELSYEELKGLVK
jgi:hypothetical protein